MSSIWDNPSGTGFGASSGAGSTSGGLEGLTKMHSTSSSPAPSRSAQTQSPAVNASSPLFHSSSLNEMKKALDTSGGKKSTTDSPRSPSPFDFGGMDEGLDGPSETNCPYCHRTYRQPRLLRCLHALCEDCIIAQLERRPDDLSLINTKRFGPGRYGRGGHHHHHQPQPPPPPPEDPEPLLSKQPSQQSDLMDELEPTHAREHKPPPGVIRCPVCKQDSQVGNDIRFVSNLLIDYVTLNMLDTNAVHTAVVLCETCKGKEQAIARCQDCCKMICKNCVQAHQYMRCFDGHVVIYFDDMKHGGGGEGKDSGGRSIGGSLESAAALIHRPINCQQHPNEPYKYACATCNVLICNECVVSEHRPNDNHQLHKIDSNTDQALRDELKKLLGISEVKVSTINEAHCNLEQRLDGLKTQVELGREAVQNAFDRYAEILEEHRHKMLQELEDLYARDERDMNDRFKTVANTTEKVNDAVRFAQRLLTYGNSVEMLMSRQTVTDQLLQLLRSLPNNVPAPNLQYQFDESQFKNALYGACGYFKNEVFSSAPMGTPSSATSGTGGASGRSTMMGNQQQSGAGWAHNIQGKGNNDGNALNPVGVLKPCIFSTGTPLNPLDLPKQYQQIIQQVMQHQHHQQQQPQPPQQPPMAAIPPSLSSTHASSSSHSQQHHTPVPPPGLMAPPGGGQLPPMPPGFAGLGGLGGLQQWNPQQQLQLMELAQQIQAAGAANVSHPSVSAFQALLNQRGMPGQPGASPLATSLATAGPLLTSQPNRMSVDSAYQSRPLTGTGLPSGFSTPSVSSNSLFETMTGINAAALNTTNSARIMHMQQQQQSRPVTSLGRPIGTGANTATVNALTGGAGLLDQRAAAFGLPHQGGVGGNPLVGTLPSPLTSVGAPFAAAAAAALSAAQQQQKPFSLSPTNMKQTMGVQPLAFQPISTPPSDLMSNLHLADGGSKDQSPPGENNPPVRQTSTMQQMQIRNRFGTLGPGHGQFNSPHGFCLGFDEEIVVADTNNHRVQIFNKTAQFLKQFGVAGKEDGQMWYPRKVAVLNRGDAQFYIVCDRGSERSRMQIFTREGVFHKKIAIRYVDIVAGLAVDSDNNVVAVDSVSPTVFKIGIENGELIKWFDCSEYMKEPSDIAVSSSNEYYICDFKGHCVCVFSDEGKFLRKIGQIEVTSFPNGIDISDAGDVLIGDSHGNRFHVAIYKRTGEFETEFECPSIKVSRCCGLRITSEGLIVTLAKNNHYALILNTLYVT